MKILVVVIFVIALKNVALAKTCTDSDKGQNPKVPGKVVYSLGDENCLGDSCYTQYMKEHDRCIDEKTVLEFSCEKDMPIEKEIKCDKIQVCKDGACVTK